MSTSTTPLRAAVDALARHYGKPRAPFPTDPWQQVLWVNVAYLADDTERGAAFDQLKREIGLAPEAVYHASLTALRRVTSHGILADQFARKLRSAAQVLLEEFDGDLEALIRAPLATARRGLRRFPGIGEPGADMILLFAGRQSLLAPDSNALRVVERFMGVPMLKSYRKRYLAVQDLATRQLGHNLRTMQSAQQLLRRHGLDTCRGRAPACERCPIATRCAHGSAVLAARSPDSPASTSRRHPPTRTSSR